MKRLFLLVIAAVLAANLYSREIANNKAAYRAIYNYFSDYSVGNKIT